MSDGDDSHELSIGEIATRTGVAEATLRMWETRYEFPAPVRLPSGHRRYSVQDAERVGLVLRARREGLSLPMAIRRARQLEAEPRPSVYGALRERFPYLHPQLLPRRALVWLSHAIEDECCARSPRPILFACFQREQFYRRAQERWRTLSASATSAIVLADFPRAKSPRNAPTEIPITAADPVSREWVVICDAPRLSACLAGWERPSDPGQPRRFETIWTVDPVVVREAARVCCDLVAQRAPKRVEDLRVELAPTPPAADEGQMRAAVELATRIVVDASAGAPGSTLTTPARPVRAP